MVAPTLFESERESSRVSTNEDGAERSGSPCKGECINSLVSRTKEFRLRVGNRGREPKGRSANVLSKRAQCRVAHLPERDRYIAT